VFESLRAHHSFQLVRISIHSANPLRVITPRRSHIHPQLSHGDQRCRKKRDCGSEAIAGAAEDGPLDLIQVYRSGSTSVYV
jgi:hypothetical protein